MISNMGLLRNSDSMEGFNSSSVDGMMPLSDQGFSHHHDHQLPPPIFNHEIAPRSLQNFDLVAADDFVPAGQGGLCNNMSMMMMMMMTMPEPDQTQQMTLSSPSVSGTGVFDPTKGSRKTNQLQLSGKKRKRMSELEKEKKHREVVHVRAKRGQATDSHSLAERLRREKINEKLRCLQDLVPGCYKTMGMAVMLDVTINYVRSLQNQIDFLSTKLSAASLFYDFNSPLAEAMETIQQGTNEHEAAAAQGMEKQIGGEAYGESSHFQPAAAWPF